MRIIKLTAENIKKIKAVEIAPDGSLVEITGPNGSGKSSVLDAIFYALAGTTGIPTDVIRQGEEKAFVKLDLGELVVTRRFTAAGGTTLTVESVDGARYPSPQRMLDDLVGALSFDPLEFARMEPRAQLEALRRVVQLDVDINALDAQMAHHFAERTVLNREVKKLEARLAGLPAVIDPENVPAEPVDVNARIAALDDAATRNTRRAEEQARRESELIKIETKHAAAADFRHQATRVLQEAHERAAALIREAESRSNELSVLAEQKERDAADDERVLRALPPLEPAVDTTELRLAINRAVQLNAQVELKRVQTTLQKELTFQREASNRITLALEDADKQRTDVITRAVMPVPDLTFGHDEVLLHGLPLTVASDAEQLRVSVAIAMAANPRLRVLRVKDGSLLDRTSLRLLGEMAATADYQVWIERVEAGGPVSVVMEDGAVAREETAEK